MMTNPNASFISFDLFNTITMGSLFHEQRSLCLKFGLSTRKYIENKVTYYLLSAKPFNRYNFKYKYNNHSNLAVITLLMTLTRSRWLMHHLEILFLSIHSKKKSDVCIFTSVLVEFNYAISEKKDIREEWIKRLLFRKTML